MTKSNLSSLATFRKTAAVIVATASVLATALTPASAQSPTVPGKPAVTDMTVEQTGPNCRILVVRWTEPDDGGSSITSYEVRVRAYPADATPYEWEIPGEVGTPRTFLNRRFVVSRDVSEPEKHVLDFEVRARNSFGEGPWSDRVQYANFQLIVCLDDSGGVDDAESPTVPLRVSAVPGDGYVTLTWNEPSSDGGSPITGYEVGYRRTGRNGSYYIRTTSATSTDIRGLVNGVDYEFFVRARNAHGSSSWTETIIASPVGSKVSPPSVELLEIIDFMDLILEPVDHVPPPVEPIVEECPIVAKYEAESLGGVWGWWPARKTSFRIVATESWELSDGTRVNRGALGGEVKYERGSLSRFGCSWAFAGSKIEDSANVYGNAIVKENARVADKAKVSGSAVIGGGLGSTFVGGDARVSDNAQVSADARVWGKTLVHDNAQVRDYAQVYDDARLYDDAQVHGSAKVFGSAEVYGKAEVYGNSEVCGHARVHGTAVIFEDMKVCGGEYDGVQEYTREAKEIFQDVYSLFYRELGKCEAYDDASEARQRHNDALAFAKGSPPDDIWAVASFACQYVENLVNIGRAAQPNFFLATASWVAWPARLKAVLDVLTLVDTLNTLNEVKSRFGDDRKWQDAWNMNGKLRQEYDKCIAKPDDCGVSS